MRAVTSGTVYAIRCKATGRVYIGCCSDVNTRIAAHMSELKRGLKTMRISRNERGPSLFQADYNQFGEHSFEAYVIKSNVPPEERQIFEDEYIRKYKATDPAHGYNLRMERRTFPAIEIIEGVPPIPYDAPPAVRDSV